MTKSIKSLLPTHLSLDINWISPLKSSTKKLFLSLPIPPLLSLFFSSFLSQSIFSTSYYNNIICFPLQSYVAQSILSTSNLFLFSFTSTSIKGITPKVMIANILTSENISTGPQIYIFYILSILYLGAPNNPFFKKANISKLLEKFENMCNNYQMSTFEKIRYLLWYCKIFTT